MLSTIRDYFQQEKVLEVETPLLRHAVGTDPALEYFSTSLNYTGSEQYQQLYLQTSPEFAMKRMLAAGSGSIYQICKAFRNGEAGRFHNPEFTILEWYRVGYKLDDLMQDADRLLQVLLSSLTLDPTESISYTQAFERYCGLNPLVCEISDFSNFAQQKGMVEANSLCGNNLTLWQEFLFSHCVQPSLGKNRLSLVFDYPPEQAALARIKRGVFNVAERFEIFLHGVELANGFHELADPQEQSSRLDQDLAMRKSRGQRIPPKDLKFIAGLIAGLPDCSGIALGLDRLLMLMAGADSIEQVLSFSVNRA